MVDESQCLKFITLDMTRTVTAEGSELELKFISALFGGLLGVATDVYLGGFEIVVCGVLTTLLVNILTMCLLRGCIRMLFYTTVLLLFVALALMNAIALANINQRPDIGVGVERIANLQLT
jgi:hypothetical protein